MHHRQLQRSDQSRAAGSMASGNGPHATDKERCGTNFIEALLANDKRRECDVQNATCAMQSMLSCGCARPVCSTANEADCSGGEAAVGSLRQPRETECSSTGFALGNSSPILFAVITAGYIVGRESLLWWRWRYRNACRGLKRCPCRESCPQLSTSCRSLAVLLDDA